jgi:hypothetical protein
MKLNIYNNRDISDIPLIGNPQITYFKSVYRKHSHFIVNRYRQECNAGNSPNQITHLGQLIKSIDLEINITGNTNSISNNIGTSLINNINLRNNNKLIEELSGSYIEMYMKLKNPRGLKTVYSVSGTGSTSEVICNQGTIEQILSLSGGVLNTDSINASKVNIVLPIPFSFCRNIGHAFPIFLLGTNNLQVSFEINDNIVDTTPSYHFIINYIYLTENEQMRFKISNNEYLHEIIKEHDVIISGSHTGDKIVELNYVGNIKSIMWKVNPSHDPKYNIRINNGYKLFNQDKSYHYFTRKTISDAGFPGGGCSASGTVCIKHDDIIAYYSFALKEYGEEDSLAPTGSISSSSNKTELIINYNTPLPSSDSFKVYTKSYNIMNISNNNLILKYIY